MTLDPRRLPIPSSRRLLHHFDRVQDLKMMYDSAFLYSHEIYVQFFFVYTEKASVHCSSASSLLIFEFLSYRRPPTSRRGTRNCFRGDRVDDG
jgi:hypothetical protein